MHWGSELFADRDAVRRLFMRVFAALAVIFGFIAAPALADKPVGPLGQPYENYTVPWSRDSDTARWREASRTGQSETAEQIARAMIVRRTASADPVALAEAYFALGLSLDAAARHSEAEDNFLRARQQLAPLVDPSPQAERVTNGVRRRAERWAPYVDLHLRACLGHQHRFREADELPLLVEPTDEGEPPERAGFPSSIGFVTGTYFAPQLLARLGDEDRRDRYRALHAAAFPPTSANATAEAAALRELIGIEVEALGAADPLVGNHRIGLAELLLDRGDGEAAGIEAAAGRLISAQAGDLELVARSNMAIGHAAFSGGRYADALAAFTAARDGADAMLAANAAVMIGAGHYRLDDLVAAQRWYETALLYDRWTPAFRRQLRGFLARIASERGDAQRAVTALRPLCRELAELVAQGGRGVRSTNRLDGIAAELQRCAVAWLDGLTDLHRPEDPEILADAVEAIQLAQLDPTVLRMARFGARMHAGRAGVGDMADELERLVEARDASDAAPAENWPLGRSEIADPEASSRIAGYHARIGRLSIALAERAPRYWDLRMPRPVAREALTASEGADAVLLGDDEAVLGFLFLPGAEHGFVVAVGKRRSAFAALPLGTRQLGDMVNRLRGSIDTAAYGLDAAVERHELGGTQFDRALAAELYHVLMGDAQVAAVVADAQTLIFVPSGPLASLPPALLVTQPQLSGNDDDQEALRETPWLIRTHAIAVLPSVAALRTLRQILPVERVRARQPLLSFIDPALPGPEEQGATELSVRSATFAFDRELAQLRPLPFARREGEALRALLGADRDWMFVDTAASKAQLRLLSDTGRLADARVIQFATHGFPAMPFDGVVEPMLVLAQGLDTSETVLLASEVAELRINADWVILSGCNTASPGGSGGGLSGFTEAFIAAGASALLVSHWRVDDPSVARIVPQTIRHAFHSGHSRAEALRLAMLELLDDEDFGAAHPGFWAPLTLIGDPR